MLNGKVTENQIEELCDAFEKRGQALGEGLVLEIREKYSSGETANLILSAQGYRDLNGNPLGIEFRRIPSPYSFSLEDSHVIEITTVRE